MLTSYLEKFAFATFRSMHREMFNKGMCVCEAHGVLGVPVGQLGGSSGEASPVAV